MRRKKSSVLIISPETGKLPKGMGLLARYVSGKSGGMGEVVSALCEGLIERGIPVYIALPNLRERFRRESGMTEEEWINMRYKTDPDKIYLISSASFGSKSSIYDGDVTRSAAEFQEEVANNVIKNVSGRSGGRLIIHSHDWVAGGIITAYARERGIPVLHTVHNVHTRDIPIEMLKRLDIIDIASNLYYSDNKRKFVDSQATAIQNATIINYVGETFLREVVNDYFLDRPEVPTTVRKTTKEKFRNGTAYAVLNAPSFTRYPERCEHLVRNFGPDDDVIEAKKENLLEFQRRTGLIQNPNAMLFLWPSRLDPLQKGVELLEQTAQKFVTECEYSNITAQIAVIGDPIGNDTTHKQILGSIACASNGRIVYYPFSEQLCMLGYAAASDVFGASLYEPCGQIDQIGNLSGATATNRKTGGYNDKIKPLSLRFWGEQEDSGNGFLFEDYDTGGLLYGLTQGARFHSLPEEVRLPQLQRIMREVRVRDNLEKMVDKYIELYEILNGGEKLV